MGSSNSLGGLCATTEDDASASRCLLCSAWRCVATRTAAWVRWTSDSGNDSIYVVGDALNSYPVTDPRRWTHVRLSIYPDGGVARLRVHGQIMPDPAFLAGTIDLAALENGGMVIGCSDAFYSSPTNLILPGLARVMSDGWENARRRGPGNDYVIVRLAAAGRLRHVEVDTSYFVGNAPGWIALSAAGKSAAEAADELAWREVLTKTRVQPDTRHRLTIGKSGPVTHVRLDVIPDGGLARFRVYGELTEQGLAALAQRWRDTRP